MVENARAAVDRVNSVISQFLISFSWYLFALWPRYRIITKFKGREQDQKYILVSILSCMALSQF